MNTKKILLIIQITLSVLLMISILLQVRGAGLGNMFGGGGGEFYRSKRGMEMLLYRATIILAIMFIATGVALAFLYAE